MINAVLLMVCVKLTITQNVLPLTMNRNGGYLSLIQNFNPPDDLLKEIGESKISLQTEMNHLQRMSPDQSCTISGNTTSQDHTRSELCKLYETLHKTLNRLKMLREKIMVAKKNFYFYRKLLDTLLSDIQSPYIVIMGCPLLQIQQMYSFFAKLSKRLHIRFNDTNVCSMIQNRNSFQLSPAVNKSIPILVKMKTSKIKNLYLNAVKKEAKLSKSVHKFGMSVQVGKQLFKGIFVNEHLTSDKLLLYRFVFRESKKYGYFCFVNGSNIYIKKSVGDEPIIVNSRHILRVMSQKKAGNKSPGSLN